MATHLRTLCSTGAFNSRMLCSTNKGLVLQSVATFKNFAVPPSYNHIKMPEERPKLQFLQKTPQYFNMKAPKYSKRLDLVRGFEEINNEFLHGPYGVISLGGGWLEWGHIEMMRNTVAKKIDYKKMIPHWRIESPWLPRTKKGTGHRMGQGKANINRYVYPVKPDRVVLEISGKCSFEEVEPILRIVAENLPFPAEAISAKNLAEKRRMSKIVEDANVNVNTFKYLAQNDILGCRRWLTNMDKLYFGKCV